MRTVSIRPFAGGIAAATLAMAVLAPEAAAQWTFRGAPDPIVRNIQILINTPAAGSTTLFASTQGAGIFKGVDSAAGGWTMAPYGSGLPTDRIFNMRAPSLTNHYAATDGYGVYRSTDGIGTWFAINGAGATALGCHIVRNIVLPVAGTIYASTSCSSKSGFWRSTDNGANWAQLGVGVIPDDTNGVGGVFVSGTLIIAATEGYGLFKSTDSGTTFAASSAGLPANATSYGVVNIGSTTTSLIAYILPQGIYLSTDTGATWAQSNAGLPADRTSLTGVIKDPLVNTTFYLPLDGGGIYRSTDSGANWSPWGNTVANPDTQAMRAFAYDTPRSTFYFAAIDGMKKTADNGLTFSYPQTNLNNGSVSSIAHDFANPRLAYVTAYRPARLDNIYAATYDDTNTALLDVGITGATHTGAIYQDPLVGAILYVTSANKGIFRSTNAGATWSPINTGLPADLSAQNGRIAIDRNNPQVILLGLSGKGMYKTTDGGANWALSQTGLSTARSQNINNVVFARSSSTDAYASTKDGLYKSTDAGANWARIFSANDDLAVPLGVNNARVTPGNLQEIYLANSHRNPDGSMVASSGVWKSGNGGTTWSQVLAGKLATNLRVDSGGVVYVTLEESPGQPPVLRSGDGGATWSPLGGGLTGPLARTFGVSGDGNQRVLSVATYKGIHTLALNDRPDFNNDGLSDLLWRNGLGNTYAWYMNGPSLISDAFVAGIDPSWKIAGIADFNGDGKPDLVWRNGIGNTYVWYMDGPTFISDAFLFSLPPEWVIQGVADFNKDGKPDFMMRNTISGNGFVWFFNNNLAIGDQFLFNIDPSWKVEAVADFNLDGQPDLLFRSMASGLSFEWDTQFSGGVLSLAASSPPIYSIDPIWEVVQVADWNSDGKPDLVFRSATTGVVFVWYLNGITLAGSDFIIQIDPSWEIVPRP